MVDDHVFFLYKWKTTSSFSEMEDYLIFEKNGRRTVTRNTFPFILNSQSHTLHSSLFAFNQMFLIFIFFLTYIILKGFIFSSKVHFYIALTVLSILKIVIASSWLSFILFAFKYLWISRFACLIFITFERDFFLSSKSRKDSTYFSV